MNDMVIESPARPPATYVPIPELESWAHRAAGDPSLLLGRNDGLRDSYWRTEARRIIRFLLASNPDADESKLSKLIRDAYPWGDRASWPYKCWLKERRLALESRRS